MMRISTIFFCVLLAATVAGRYQAVATVRADKKEIRAIEAQIEEEERRVSQLNLDVQVLESTTRISQLSQHRLDLTTVKPYQLSTAEDFATLIAMPLPMARPVFEQQDQDFILDAIAMADIMKTR